MAPLNSMPRITVYYARIRDENTHTGSIQRFELRAGVESTDLDIIKLTRLIIRRIVRFYLFFSSTYCMCNFQQCFSGAGIILSLGLISDKDCHGLFSVW